MMGKFMYGKKILIKSNKNQSFSVSVSLNDDIVIVREIMITDLQYLHNQIGQLIKEYVDAKELKNKKV